ITRTDRSSKCPGGGLVNPVVGDGPIIVSAQDAYPRCAVSGKEEVEDVVIVNDISAVSNPRARCAAEREDGFGWQIGSGRSDVAQGNGVAVIACSRASAENDGSTHSSQRSVRGSPDRTTGDGIVRGIGNNPDRAGACCR